MTEPQVEREAAARTRAPCVVHIGYHRAASSFLQLNVFALLDGYVGAGDVDVEPGRAATIPRLADTSGGSPGVILSNENLSGDLDRDRPDVADAIHARNPDARIVIAIRSQYAIFRAFYFLHIKGGETGSLEAFVRPRLGALFTYRAMVERYRTLFGADNVHVMLHEDLLADGNGTLRRLLGFIGADPDVADRVDHATVKPSAGDLTLRLLRARNAALAPLRTVWPAAAGWVAHLGLPTGMLGPLEGHPLARLPMDRMRPMIRDAYAEDNAALFAMLGKDIAAYDYPQPGRG